MELYFLKLFEYNEHIMIATKNKDLLWENTCCSFLIEFITEYTYVRHVIITRNIIKSRLINN